MIKAKTGLFGLVAFTAGLAGCVSPGFEPMAVTRDQSVVASCQNLGNVSVPASKTYDDSVKSLIQVASTKGANTLYVTSPEATDPPTDNELTGVAYKCAMPASSATH